MRRPGESELDYYERRYQERVNFVKLRYTLSTLSLHLAKTLTRNSCPTQPVRYKRSVNNWHTQR